MLIRASGSTGSEVDAEDSLRAISGSRRRHAAHGVRNPASLTRIASTGGSPFYERNDVAGASQFAVRPSHQSYGIGGTLLRLVEELAGEKGVAALGLDTSEDASDLIAMYVRKGYRFVEHTQWSETNYRSVVLGKPLR